MRPLWYSILLEYIYIECVSFLIISGNFAIFSQCYRTYGRTDGKTLLQRCEDASKKRLDDLPKKIISYPKRFAEIFHRLINSVKERGDVTACKGHKDLSKTQKTQRTQRPVKDTKTY